MMAMVSVVYRIRNQGIAARLMMMMVMVMVMVMVMIVMVTVVMVVVVVVMVLVLGGVIRFTGIHCNLICTHVSDYEY
jgi:hypothetical protein